MSDLFQSLAILLLAWTVFSMRKTLKLLTKQIFQLRVGLGATMKIQSRDSFPGSIVQLTGKESEKNSGSGADTQ